MFNVNFYKFSKRENSTKRPNEQTQQLNYSCILKEPSGILSPTISLNIGLSDNPSEYNYCYIPIFNRYYFITEWYFENALWHANLKVDVLASAKDEIGAKDLYILRSSAEFNSYIADSKYPTKSNVSSDIQFINAVSVYNEATGQTSLVSDYFEKDDFSDGMYYIGVIGHESVEYYSLGYTAFKNLCNQLYTYVPSDYQDVSTGLAKKIANPIEYIVSCYWLPYAIPGVDYSIPSQVNIGEWTFNQAGGVAKVYPRIDNCKSFVSVNLPKHPLANTRGKYLNTPPYADYQLIIEPFGAIQIDASALVDVSTLDIEWFTDIATGIANLYVFGEGKLVASANAQLGVPVMLTQVDYDITSYGTYRLAQKGASGDFLGGFFSTAFDVGGSVISNMTSGIISSNGQLARSQSVGTMGNFLAFNSRLPALYSIFYDIVDEYNQELGRPLCAIRKPSALGGYMMILDGSLEAPYTQSELTEINAYLTGGFFYE